MSVCGVLVTAHHLCGHWYTASWSADHMYKVSMRWSVERYHGYLTDKAFIPKLRVYCTDKSI